MLALSRKYNVPTRHGDVPNAYVRADKGSHFEILLHMPRGMTVTTTTLADVGVTNKRQMTLRLRKSLCGLKQTGRTMGSASTKGTIEARLQAKLH